MKIKVKNLTNEQIMNICNQYPVECNDQCPLYRLKIGQPRLCLTQRKDLLNTEIEIDERILNKEWYMNREEHIMNRLSEHYNYAVGQGYEVVCLMLQGSQNYELDVYTDEYKSDIDTKAIVLPSEWMKQN